MGLHEAFRVDAFHIFRCVVFITMTTSNLGISHIGQYRTHNRLNAYLLS
jgi:hypothetical protein